MTINSTTGLILTSMSYSPKTLWKTFSQTGLVRSLSEIAFNLNKENGINDNMDARRTAMVYSHLFIINAVKSNRPTREQYKH